MLYCGLYSGHIVHYFMIYDTCHLFFLTCQGDGDSTSDMDHACDDMDFTGQWTIVFECGVPLLIFNHGDYYLACVQ